MYIYGDREKWDPYFSKGKAYENAKDVWTRNQVKITTEEEQGCPEEGVDPQGEGVG